MICQKCNTPNNSEAKFCIKCGNSLLMSQNTVSQNEVPTAFGSQEINHSNVENINMSQPGVVRNFTPPSQEKVETTNMNSEDSKTKATKMSFGAYFFLIISMIIKPFTTYQEHSTKLNETKNSFILSAIVAIITTIVATVTAIIQTVRVTSFYPKETKWVWENLKSFKYFEVIGKNLLIYLGIIILIAAVYYIVSLILKKESNFSRMLGISALSLVPVLVCAYVLSPILSFIYAPFGMAITLIGTVYSSVILYESMNKEIVLDGNMKFYFNLICLSIIIVALYFIYTKFMITGVGTEMNDVKSILDMLG